MIRALPLLLASATAASAQLLPPEAGVSAALAHHRAATIGDVAYDLFLDIPVSKREPIQGRMAVRFRLERGGPVVLDFKQPAERVLGVTRDGRPVRYAVENGHIVLAPGVVAAGENRIEIRFLAGDGSLNRNEDYLYALFVPDRASVALPLFDQPDLKATLRLTLEVPAGWQALANGAETSRIVKGGRATYRFEETEPIPTYLIAFAVGNWRVASAQRGGRTMRLFHRESDSTKVARNLDAIFDLQANALGWLETYTGLAYPFGKYDFIAIPAFQFGGMEHPGAVYYRDTSLFLDESATQSQVLGRASLIAHESAHMWFGDLVTMRWFNDVWTKEVFANFMAAKIVNPAFPEVDHDLRFFLGHHPAAYEIDRSAGANPIRQPLDNLLSAGTLYGAIIYDKAPIVMKHLERIMGEGPFQEGMREYLRTFAYGNATWPELIRILDRRTGADLAAWSEVWVEEPGRPIVEVAVEASDDGAGLALVARQRDPAERGRVWPQALGVRIGYPDTVIAAELALFDGRAVLRLPAGRPAPDWVLPNGDGVAYGDFRLPASMRETLIATLPSLADPLLRGVAWVTLWDAMLTGDVAAPVILDLAMRVVPAESDELTIQRVLADAGSAYWRFIDDEARARLAPHLEDLIWQQLLYARGSSLKATYYNAFERIALTGPAVRRLNDLWTGALTVEGLTLSERDRTGLALALAVRGVPDADAILDAQLAEIENPDRRARLAFIRPAVSADSATRAAFFQGLKRIENRAHEPWVLDAVAHLNHPLRARSALPFLRDALALVEEIQRTGDIFFPKRWLDATLAGHSDPEAAAIVRAFLAEHPDYPPKLREKVLQSADELLRSAER